MSRLLVFPVATMISGIHLALTLSLISIKVVLTNNGNVEHSRSNVVESMNNDKDNEQSMNNDKDIELNTVIVEQSTSNVVQSSINVEQSVDVVTINNDKCSSINVE